MDYKSICISVKLITPKHQQHGQVSSKTVKDMEILAYRRHESFKEISASKVRFRNRMRRRRISKPRCAELIGKTFSAEGTNIEK